MEGAGDGVGNSGRDAAVWEKRKKVVAARENKGVGMKKLLVAARKK